MGGRNILLFQPRQRDGLAAQRAGHRLDGYGLEYYFGAVGRALHIQQLEHHRRQPILDSQCEIILECQAVLDPLTDNHTDISDHKPNSKRSRADYDHYLWHGYRDR